MALTEKKVAQREMTTTLVTVYTVPDNTRLYLKTFDICNTSLFERRATVHLVPRLGAPGAGTTIVPDVEMPARSMLQWTGLQILDDGDSIQVVADDAGVTINMSGAESTF